MTDFIEFPGIKRLFRDCVITEKLDGTNAQIHITDAGDFFVGSRSRWITPQDDNYGFARWAYANKDELMKLGPGSHFGEWWGNGIQRGYGLKNGDKRFHLFNVARWVDQTEYAATGARPPLNEKQEYAPDCCGVVPVLYRGAFDTAEIRAVLANLETNGSVAAPGFMRPEGIVVWHDAARVLFKTTIGDDGHKTAKVK